MASLARVLSRPEDSSNPGASSWTVVRAVVPGPAHERLGIPCQDAVADRLLPNGVLIAALADGAGSARFSDQGARLVVAKALSALESGVQALPQDDFAGWECSLRTAFRRARTSLRRFAYRQRQPLVEYAATLTCVIAGDAALAVGQIGDGALVCRDLDGELFSATRIQKGEFANETYFLTQRDALKKVEIRTFDQPISALAITSDGLFRLGMQLPAGEPFAPFFEPLFAFARSVRDPQGADARLADFLSSERVRARADDDKSLLIAVRPDRFL